jgi:hypothetical protein
MVPPLALALALSRLGLTQTTMLLMPLFTALTASYLYLSARRLGYSPAVGIATALLAGLTTTIWSQAGDLVAEPLMFFSFTATFYYGLAYRQDQRLSQAALMGLVLSLTVLHKAVNVMAVPLFFGYTFWPDLSRERLSFRRLLRAIDWGAVAIAVALGASCLLVMGLYNAMRFGNPLDTGYPFLFKTPFWVGFTGFLVSPYKSLFLYSPVFILILFTLRRTWQRHSLETVLILILLGGQMVIFGAWYDWGGGKSWGPRFLVPLNGLLILLLLPFIERAFQPGRWAARLSLVGLGLAGFVIQILGFTARDKPYLDASHYWTPSELSLWGELSWTTPDQWPIWGHLLRFNFNRIPVIWRWQWVEISHFDPLSLLAALLIVAAGLAGLVNLYRRPGAKRWLAGGWCVALICAGIILARSYDDPRSIKDAAKADKLWPAYSGLMAQLPDLVAPADAVIFTDRRFEFYLLDRDKSAAQRYVIAKDTQPRILETVPELLARAGHRRIWLVTDALDNRQLAYATELWLAERSQVVGHHRFGESVELTAFEPEPASSWPPIPLEPPLTGVVKPDDYTFNGIASLLGWDWPTLEAYPVLQAGRSYDFELYWIYRGKAPQDRFFVRLLDQQEQVVAEAFTRPRSDDPLIPGNLLVEETSLTLPADLPAGRYHLQIGFKIPVVEEGELIFDLPPELTELDVVSPAES